MENEQQTFTQDPITSDDEEINENEGSEKYVLSEQGKKGGQAIRFKSYYSNTSNSFCCVLCFLLFVCVCVSVCV